MENVNKEFYIGTGSDKKLVVFNLNVMADIQSDFNTVDEWIALVDRKGDGQEPDAKALIKGFTYMLNEGVEIENEKDGGKRKAFTTRDTGRIITELGMANVQKAMATAIINSNDTGEKPKNV